MVGYALEHVTQIRLRIQAVELCRLDQDVDRRRALTTGVGPGKRPFRLPIKFGRMARSAA